MTWAVLKLRFSTKGKEKGMLVRLGMAINYGYVKKKISNGLQLASGTVAIPVRIGGWGPLSWRKNLYTTSSKPCIIKLRFTSLNKKRFISSLPLYSLFYHVRTIFLFSCKHCDWLIMSVLLHDFAVYFSVITLTYIIRFVYIFLSMNQSSIMVSLRLIFLAELIILYHILVNSLYSYIAPFLLTIKQ